jgi:hypothetical protein
MKAISFQLKSLVNTYKGLKLSRIIRTTANKPRLVNTYKGLKLIINEGDFISVEKFGEYL